MVKNETENRNGTTSYTLDKGNTANIDGGFYTIWQGEEQKVENVITYEKDYNN